MAQTVLKVVVYVCDYDKIKVQWVSDFLITVGLGSAPHSAQTDQLLRQTLDMASQIQLAQSQQANSEMGEMGKAALQNGKRKIAKEKVQDKSNPFSALGIGSSVVHYYIGD